MKTPYVHVHHGAQVDRGQAVILETDGITTDVTCHRVLEIDRAIRVGEVPGVWIKFHARLVEHEDV